MQYLIDTHTFLWFTEGSNELSLRAKSIIADKNNQIYLSIGSLWEISIKTAIGKLEVLADYELIIDDVVGNDIEILPINFAHTVIQNRLPFYHRDPFDRIIVSQAIAENIDLISIDTIFDSYFSDKEVSRIG
ncbi:MAG: type II toxin-antitoxin system VapC family toxin [Arcicella sp.]|jgi:PIN domain nuclease of toxin-antitoxin system|nr:type II toxin-antitoxin system VapC family toxin [Arcicella sp.]